MSKTYEQLEPVISVLADNIDKLNGRLTGLINGSESDFPFTTTWAQGGFTIDGDYSSWSRIRSDYIDISSIGALSVVPDSGYAALFAAYTEDKTVTRISAWSTEANTVSVVGGEKYIRLCLRKDPEANLSPAHGTHVHITAVYRLSKDASVAIDAIDNMGSEQIDGYFKWSIGGISNGANYNTSSKIRTSHYNVEKYSLLNFTAQDGYKYAVSFYDKDKTYLFTFPAAGYVSGANLCNVDDKIAYIRIMLAKDPEETLSDTSISANLACFGSAKLVGKVLSNVDEWNDLASDTVWIRGMLDDDGVYAESTSRVVSDNFISVDGLESIRVLPLVKTISYIVCFFSDDGKVSNTNITTGEYTFIVPANSTKIKIVLYNNPDAWLADGSIGKGIRVYGGKISNNFDGNVLIKDYFVATSVNKKEIPSLDTGKTIITIGDSITAATDATGWTYHFQQMTGVTIINKAIGGSTFGESVSDQTHRIGNQIATVTSEQWASADMVIVAAGTNDYQHETPLSELKEKVASAIASIKENTNAPVVFITPIRRGLGYNKTPIRKIAMISGIISNVALANQCNVICGYDFPIPTYNINGLIDNMTRDALHPVASGANVYARSVINALM